MNILDFHKQIISNYKSYIQSFLNIKDPKILDFVENEIDNKKLWPEPLIQFNPTFEDGELLYQLIKKNLLHEELDKIFARYSLYKHQEEAILLGAKDKEFIVTSGTGSGKSLTYLATIFNHVLKKKKEDAASKIQAIIVYPMNALINSQYNEINKFKLDYESAYDREFPITFGQYTGQESEEEKENQKLNPPHILLTNYMMLELLMTRSGRDAEIRDNFLANAHYLVFDELHTYRGRQGSDVSILIRRIKAAAHNNIKCIGTSATMVSGDDTTLREQKEKVAEVASTIFGSDITPEQIVNEYLVRSMGLGHSPSKSELANSIASGIDKTAGTDIFKSHPVANWIEENIALELKENIYVRRKPVQISKIADMLADEVGKSAKETEAFLLQLLEWANNLNSTSKDKKKFLPYRIHQFIAQTGSVYSTLESQHDRDLFMDAGRYADSEEHLLYPLMFSRTSGHEFYCVTLDTVNSVVKPREFTDYSDEEDDISRTDGYIIVQHEEDNEELWDIERDIHELPDTWFSPPRKDGSRRLKKEREARLPIEISFNKTGEFSLTNSLDYKGWFMPAPLMFDPTSGIFFETRTAEWTKLMKLGGEGRSTATTVLSFETITQLKEFNEPESKQKLLSFTDNRQDASLQAGHFNDFIKVGQLRAAIAKALEANESLDYTNIRDKVFDCLKIDQEQYALRTAHFPGPKKENEDALKDLIMYRLLHDLRRSWRVVMPNLEQCALLEIDYKYLSESVKDEGLWQSNEFLASMYPNDRAEFVYQILDFFRKSYALCFSMLEPGAISANSNKIKEKLKSPWTLEEHEKLEVPSYIRIEKLANNASRIYTESGGPLSGLGRYIKGIAAKGDFPIQSKNEYNVFVYDLFDFLCNAGWLSKKTVQNYENEVVNIYQLNVDYIIWKRGDGKNIKPDLIKARGYKTLIQKPNTYFQHFYKTDFFRLKEIEGREHTGQINSVERKAREQEFREGKIGALYCSPTMELGIDISDLSIVHMRNVPPSPANYAQRSGRAGRSGQAALVMVYCSNTSAHDRHFFKHSTEMVAGSVTAPRIDLVNEELLRSHLHATILSFKPISALNNSFQNVIDTTNLNKLDIKEEVLEILKIDESQKAKILNNYKKVIDDSYFKREFGIRKPAWFSDKWINYQIYSFISSFDNSLNRWRKLYRDAQIQITNATSIIDNRIYAEDHQKKIEAHYSMKQAERQRDLLLNDMLDGGKSKRDQSEFYPYRYLASEGFLPGYNFTRLPIRSFMESKDGGGEYISRARFMALNEFGPRNVIYHDGTKYRIDRLILSEAESRMTKGKVCPDTGYFLYDHQYDYETDPITNEQLRLDTSKHIHTNLIEMAETLAYEMQRITSQEEERSKKGYDTQTYFAVDDGFENSSKGVVGIGDESLLNIHYYPSCRIFKLNTRWRASQEQGFVINLKTGYWQSKKQQKENENSEELKTVKLFTSDTANAIYIQPVKALALEGGSNGVITLMYALKRAIENHFQVESSEIGVSVMGKEEAPNIFIYEAAEGSLGVLSQLVENPDIFTAVMEEAYDVCFVKDGVEEKGKVLPATYDDLLNYYNQYYHEFIDRNLVRHALNNLKKSSVIIQTNKAFDSYDEQYDFLQKTRDPNSSTEDKFLKYLYNNGLRLPDESQPNVNNMFVKPDFSYKPNVYIFCDGTPHDGPEIQKDDIEKRNALKAAGYQVLSWYYMDSLDDFVARRPDIFKKVKE